MFSKPKKTLVHVYRVTRPIFYRREPLPVGSLVELPPWLGTNLMSAGRVEMRDKVEGFDAVEAVPAFRTASVTRR